MGVSNNPDIAKAVTGGRRIIESPNSTPGRVKPESIISYIAAIKPPMVAADILSRRLSLNKDGELVSLLSVPETIIRKKTTMTEIIEYIAPDRPRVIPPTTAPAAATHTREGSTEINAIAKGCAPKRKWHLAKSRPTVKANRSINAAVPFAFLFSTELRIPPSIQERKPRFSFFTRPARPSLLSLLSIPSILAPFKGKKNQLYCILRLAQKEAKKAVEQAEDRGRAEFLYHFYFEKGGFFVIGGLCAKSRPNKGYVFQIG
jgi:hypothetical protein